MPWRTIVPLTVVCLMLGAFFGSAEVATVAFAEDLGVKRYAGVLLACGRSESLAAGLVSGALDLADRCGRPGCAVARSRSPW